MIPSVSVVIPTLNDARTLARTLSRLQQDMPSCEILVSDGGSEDGTEDLLARHPSLRLVRAPRGRARQCNAGAAEAVGEFLLFLHADTLPPIGWLHEVTRALKSSRVALAAFRLVVDARGFRFRLLERGVGLRSRALHLPYGDQGLAVRRADFKSWGGFPDWPLMEDVGLVHRARSHGRIMIMPLAARTSARRWIRDGFAARTRRNLLTLGRHLLGVDPATLYRGYGGCRPAVAVFARRPDPGRVKTRLAATIGNEAAVELYTRMLRQALIAAMDCAWEPDVALFHDPPDAGTWFRTQLGAGFLVHPQAAGELGQRMLAALEACFQRGATHTVVMGSDCPELGPGILARAFRLLRRHELVLGPAQDGGYYLIGCRRPHAVLFQGIPWSTDAVLAATLAIAKRERLSVSLLPPLRDLDTVEDLQEFRRRGIPLADGAPL